MNDGFRSFPSGHSSCAIFLAALKQNRRADVLCSILCWVDLLVPIYCREVAFIRLARTCGLSFIKSILGVTWVRLTKAPSPRFGFPFSLSSGLRSSLSAVQWTTDVGAVYLGLAPAGLTFYLSTDHWQDVVAGSFLGILTAYFSYRLYYPSLSSELAHLPYSPRIHRLDASLPTHTRPEDGPSYYHRRSGSDTEVELLHGTVRKNDPAPQDQVWKQGPSVESGLSR